MLFQTLLNLHRHVVQELNINRTNWYCNRYFAHGN